MLELANPKMGNLLQVITYHIMNYIEKDQSRTNTTDEFDKIISMMNRMRCKIGFDRELADTFQLTDIIYPLILFKLVVPGKKLDNIELMVKWQLTIQTTYVSPNCAH